MNLKFFNVFPYEEKKKKGKFNLFWFESIFRNTGYKILTDNNNHVELESWEVGQYMGGN